MNPGILQLTTATLLLLGGAHRAPSDLPKVLQTQLDSGLIRGTALAVVESGTPDQIYTVGDISSAHSKLEIGSVSKSFVGIVAAQLSLEGRLDLHAPISQYVPELAGSFAGSATVELLGTHSARFPHSYIDANGWVSEKFSEPELIAYLTKLKPLEGPSVRVYSNLGFATLGLVVSRITGQSVAEVIRTRVFEPLEMKESGFITSNSPPTGLVPGFNVLLEPLAYDSLSDLPIASGGIVSTLRDMVIYLKANLDPSSTPSGSAMALSHRLGLGWDSEPGAEQVWKNGAMPAGYSSLIEFDPARKRGAVALANELDTLTTSAALKDALGEKVEGLPDLAVKKDFADRVSGEYRCEEDHETLSIFSAASGYLGLEVKEPGQDPRYSGLYRARLLQVREGIFLITDGLDASQAVVFKDATDLQPAKLGKNAYLGKDPSGKPIYKASECVRQSTTRLPPGRQ